MNSSSSRVSLAAFLLRVGVGSLLLPHGLGKLVGAFGGPGLAGFQAELVHFGLPDSASLALALAVVQTAAGAMLVIGLFSRTAAVLAAGFLATTIALNWPNGWFWMGRGIEYPVLWTIASLCVALQGPGRWSLDALFASRGSNR